ncbi:MAG: response regulator [Phycisphaerales bacterium]|nr:MAG: response regulator [Phycisphaerales bacterium]
MSRTSISAIEIDPDHRELLRASLGDGRCDIDVWFASTGEEALREIHDLGDRSFDCIVLDFNLLNEDAADLLPRLTAAGCKCPAIIISTSDAQDVVIKSGARAALTSYPRLRPSLCTNRRSLVKNPGWGPGERSVPGGATRDPERRGGTRCGMPRYR